MYCEEKRNYFELFAIQPAFRVDEQAIEASYLQLQKVFHPDRFVTASAQEQRIAAQQSADLNEAYEMLKDSCRRAEYLLQLQGCTVAANASTSDANFLLEQMDYRERLEAVATATEDAAQAAAALYDEINRHNAQIEADFERAYAGRIMDEAQSLLLKMRFMKKLKYEAKAIVAAKEMN